MNLKFKSSEPDLSFKSIMVFLDLMNGNLLYVSRELDKLVRITTSIKNDRNLQTQVDTYFDKDKEDIPEVDTSD